MKAKQTVHAGFAVAEIQRPQTTRRIMHQKDFTDRRGNSVK